MATPIVEFEEAPLPRRRSQDGARDGSDSADDSPIFETDEATTDHAPGGVSQSKFKSDADAAVLSTDVPPERRPGWIRWIGGGIWRLIRTTFGMAVIAAVLSLLAAVPILNFLVLGYLLDAQGRVARSGRLWDAVPLLDIAPRLGTILIGFSIFLAPLQILTNVAADARVIHPGSPADTGLHIALRIASWLVTIHLCLALARGGTLGCFFRPIRNIRRVVARLRDGTLWSTAENGAADFIAKLQLRHFFSLGVRGFIGAFAWLVIPSALFAASTRTEGGPILITLFGGVLLMVVLAWVPFLQAHFAAENRLGAAFELRKVRELYRHTPFSWVFTLAITLTLALPLYLFKIALTPRDATWLITPVFLASIYPAKILAGWAYYHATHREKRAWLPWRWINWLIMLPLLAIYVLLLFFTQFIGERGKAVLFEHHVFLLPVPF